jgi:hypothetical protein
MVCTRGLRAHDLARLPLSIQEGFVGRLLRFVYFFLLKLIFNHQLWRPYFGGKVRCDGLQLGVNQDLLFTMKTKIFTLIVGAESTLITWPNEF